MNRIYIRGGKATNTAVKVLTAHLLERGHQIVRKSSEPYDAMVCWGMSPQGLAGPSLNAGVNQFNKFEAIQQFHRKRIPAPIVFRAREVGENQNNTFPWLARKFHHKGGKDIQVVNGLGEARRMVIQYQPDFFSVYIPTKTEYRVWTFKGKAFSVYEKVFKGEGEYEGVQRNHAFGFRFDKRDDLLTNEALCHWGVQAVKALGMDMGAVDIIESKEGELYVLEVNSMPAIDSVKKVSGIRLAKLISDWAEEAA